MIKNIFNFIKENLKRGLDKNDIDIKEFEEKAKNGAIILDVRNKSEYKEGHINGAISFPDYDINEENIKKLKLNQNDIILVYCSTGGRSKNAKNKLEKLGFKNVYNLYSGWNY